jgi:hypothetical protein
MRESRNDQDATPSPREALGLCHRCIAGMLDRVEALAAELAEGSALVSEIDEALNVHVTDEESDVFPAVLAAADSPARRAQAFSLVSSLLVEHRELAELWHALRIAFLALGGGVSVAFPGGTAADFLVRARAHLEREDLELGDLMGIVDRGRSREIAIAIANRHDEACPGLRNCPRKG